MLTSVKEWLESKGVKMEYVYMVAWYLTVTEVLVPLNDMVTELFNTL